MSKSWIWKLPWNLISTAALEHKLQPRLVAAVVQTESGGNFYATRYEPDFRWTLNIQKMATRLVITYDTEEMGQMISWGLMQIMGSVAREHGYVGYLTELVDPELSLHYGCKHLKLKKDKYGPDVSDIYAAYNAGSVRKNNSGQYANQRQVDNFMRYYGQLGAIQ